MPKARLEPFSHAAIAEHPPQPPLRSSLKPVFQPPHRSHTGNERIVRLHTEPEIINPSDSESLSALSPHNQADVHRTNHDEAPTAGAPDISAPFSSSLQSLDAPGFVAFRAIQLSELANDQNTIPSQMLRLGLNDYEWSSFLEASIPCRSIGRHD